MTAQIAQPHKAHILIVEDDSGSREILMKKSKYSIGRSPKCDIILNSPFVSRCHATLIRKFNDDGNTFYEVIDGDDKGQNSANGILINGRKVNGEELKHGDKLVFGPQVFAIYQHCQRDIFPLMPPDDPFDITLIDPAMMVNELD